MRLPNSVCRRAIFPTIAVLLLFVSTLSAASPRALPTGVLPNDSRLKPLKDLDGYFPFAPPKSEAEWNERAERVRRQILVAEGLWPMPTKTPLHAVIHGKIERPDYTVEKVYFESAPGFFVTSNLYRPKKITGKVPGVLFAHGHWKDARLSESSDEAIQNEIATGQERFERGGRSIFQSMCVQLARMGCIVWQWDMLSDSDSIQFSPELIHKFAKQRPEMNTTENWGLFSPQAEAHLQSVMGLQTWNAVRSLDFLSSLPDVDPERIAMTGASGGGTQTMILSAIDPRIKLAFPAVMVSTAMQGGCTCENASLLRVDTGNVEVAALFAPKPLGMTTANDWTKQMPAKGFPQLQELYAVLGKPDNVMLARGEQFPHNYNAVSRAAFYKWLNEHFKLVPPEAAIEKDYEPLHRDQLTVWDKDHPAPKATGPDFERKLLRWFTDDAEKQIRHAAESPEEFRKLVAPAIEVLIGRTYATAGDSEWTTTEKVDRGDYLEMTGLVHNKTYNEELPVVWLYPKKWNGRVILWLDDAGKTALFNRDAPAERAVGDGPQERLQPTIAELVKSGATVLGADLLYQGEFLKDGEPLKQTRTVANKREAPAYTFGYNHALFAQRTHDILTLLKFIRTEKIKSIPSPSSVAVAAFGHTGPIAAAARAVSGDAIDAAAIDIGSFRFAKLLDYRAPDFLPGGAKYLDISGLIALVAPRSLWLAGDAEGTGFASDAYQKSGQSNRLLIYHGDAAEKGSAAATWLAH
jgi:dienelactone hydrolase